MIYGNSGSTAEGQMQNLKKEVPKIEIDLNVADSYQQKSYKPLSVKNEK